MDSIQLMLFYQDKPMSTRITMIVHHILALGCCTALYRLDPYLQYIYACNTLVEISTIFLNLRYFGRQLNNATLYLIGGSVSLVIYPLSRSTLTIYCSYTVYTGLYHLFIGYSGVCVVVACNVFVFFMSLYYSIFVLWANPRAMFRLKRKEKVN